MSINMIKQLTYDGGLPYFFSILSYFKSNDKSTLPKGYLKGVTKQRVNDCIAMFQ